MVFTEVQSDSSRQFVTYGADHRDGRCVIVVMGFDTESATLNPQHHRLLDLSMPALTAPDTVLEMYARADRTGPGGYNFRLSRRRLQAVQNYLIQQGAPVAIVRGPRCKALGERFEAHYGVADNTASRGARAVWMFTWASNDAFLEGATNADMDFRALTTFGRSY